MQFSQLLPKKFSTRLIVITISSGLIPIIIFGCLISIFDHQFLTQANHAVYRGQEEQWQRSKPIIEQMSEDFIRQKVLDVVLQLELFLQAHPEMTLEDLQNDSKFREIAVQPVGKKGYTAVQDVDTAINRFHKDSKIENLDLHSLSDKLPEFWKIMKNSLGGRYSHGYYKWKEPNGELRDKFMYIAPMNEKTADGVRLGVSATSYIDEFTRPILAAQDVSHGTTRYLMMVLTSLIQSFKTLGFLSMGLGMLFIIAFSTWTGFYFSRAVTGLQKATKAVNQGNFDIRVKPAMSGDVRQLIENFNQMLAQLSLTTVKKEQLEASRKELKTTNAQLHQEIIDREQAEEALRESEERFRELAELLPETIFEIDVSGRLIFVNRSALDQFKVTQQDVDRGLNGFEMFVPEDRQRVMENAQQILQGKQMGLVEYTALRKDGSTFPVMVNTATITHGDQPVGLRGIVIDISERVQSEKALRDSESKFRGLFDLSPQAISLTELETGKLADVNNMFCDLTQYSKEEIIGKTTTRIGFYSDDDRAGFLKELQESGEVNGLEMDFKAKDGAIITALMFARVIRISGNSFILTIFLNITEQKQLQAQLQQAQKMESIGTLAGGIAHDFNNILYSMIGYTELALDDTEKGTQLHNNLQEVLIAGNRAGDLVKQILTFSRQADRKLKPLKIQIVIREALKLIRSSLPTTIEIHQNISNTCGFVMADTTQIHQVAMNLLTNAYHALEDKGGKMDITLKEVDLDAYDLKDPAMIPGPYVCLTVADTGTGIDESIMGRIFEPYYSTKQKDKGTGLGLAMVHGIVKSCGGNIRVYSEPGKGTAFHVYLPVIQSQTETRQIQVISTVEMGKERILMVDDEEQIVRMTQQMLERLGYHVTPRTSSIETLEAFRANPDKFDLVITDMTMPNMTGVHLTQKLIEIRPDIPVIICTGFSEKISEHKAEAMGIHGYVMKPVVRSELAKKIREVLDRKT
jgi:PAS domain S-box-containing protein